MNAFLKKIKSYSAVQIMETLYLAVLGVYLLKLSFDTTLFSISWPEDFEFFWFIVSAGVVTVKLCYDSSCRGWKLIGYLAMTAAFALSWRHTGSQYLFLLYLPVLMTGAWNVGFRRILRVSFWINFATLALAFVGSCTGVLTDLVYGSSEVFRHSFGIVYPTDFAARVFYLLLTGWVLYDRIHPVISLAVTGMCAWLVMYWSRANCGTIMLILMMLVIVYEWITRRIAEKWKWVPDYLVTMAMPICAIATLYATMQYGAGTEWAITLNTQLHSRLALAWSAIQNYGFSWFGTAFEQVGSGGSTAWRVGYNFVDSAYPLILIRYGTLVFLIIVALTVYQCVSARRKNQRRLLLALALIAVHSIEEHHMPEVNYDIFLILPLATIEAHKPYVKRQRGELLRFVRENAVKYALTAAIVAVCVRAAPMVMRYARTVCTLRNYDESSRQIQFIVFCLLCVGAAAWIADTVRRLIRARFKVSRALTVRLMVSGAAVVIGGIWIGQAMQYGRETYSEVIAGETPLLEQIAAACGEDTAVYVSDVPALYQAVMESDDLCLPIEAYDKRTDPFVVIAPCDEEYKNFFQAGCYYGAISETHGVYTNDPDVIALLQSAGISMTSYYSTVRKVDLAALAGMNETEYLEDGTIQISDSGGSIIHGPYLFLTGGHYYIEFDLTLLQYNPETMPGSLRVATESGSVVWATRDLTVEDFADDGHAVITFDLSFWSDVENTEFLVAANDGTVMCVNAIRYYKVE